MVYDSSDLYDFHSGLAGGKPSTRSYWDTVERVDSHGRRSPLAAPTSVQLLRHAERFGPEMVNETAAQFGVTMARLASERPKRQRKTGPTLKAQVLELRSRGAIPTAIADTLNLSDRRVREIIREAAA